MSEEVLNSPPPKPMTAVQLRDLVSSSKTRIRHRSAHDPPEDEVGVSIANAQLAEDTSSGDDFFDPLNNQYYGWDGSYAHPPKNEVVFDLTLVTSINKLLPRINVPTWISRPIKQLDDDTLDQLVSRLNAVKANNQNWKSSEDWCNISSDKRIKYSPVSSQAKFRTGVKYNNVNYQTHKKNPKDSVIHVVSRSNGDTLFGKIIKIFDHQRFPINSQSPVTETWLLVQYYAPLAQGMPNPFSRVGEPDLQTHLRLEMSSKPYLTHLSEVVAHCAWIVYERGEIHYLLDKKSIAVVSLSR
ncbi:hypothetical protein DFH28DRAFT_885905 [Melampsora americana]|nr:hypothetical protein DFH28DRAFT_885905 [Melampsora americana]